MLIEIYRGELGRIFVYFFPQQNQSLNSNQKEQKFLKLNSRTGGRNDAKMIHALRPSQVDLAKTKRIWLGTFRISSQCNYYDHNNK